MWLSHSICGLTHWKLTHKGSSTLFQALEFLWKWWQHRAWRSRSCAIWETPDPHFGWGSIFFFRLFFILHGYVRWWPGSSPSCLFKKHPWKWRKPWGHAGAGMEHEKGCGCFHRSGAFWLCFVLYPEAGWHKLVDLTPKLWVKPSSRCQRWLPCQCPNTASSLSRHILLC